MKALRTSLALSALMLLSQPSLAIGGETVARAARGASGHTDLNEPLPDGSSQLAWAVENQNSDLVRQLIARGAKPNGVGEISVAPLFVACQYGNADILSALLGAHADVKAVRPDGITPLSLCAGTAPAAILEQMIASGAVVDAADNAGQTPLMRAAAQGRIENMKLLVMHGASVNTKSLKGFTPLFFALKSRVPEAPMVLLELGADANYIAPDGTSAVQLAMYQQDYAFAAHMIERGADLKAFDRQGNQLLHAAVLAGQPSLVKLLLAKGADANALTGTSTVKMRFEVNFKTGDYEVPPKPPLLLAAETGDAQLMQILVDGGAKPRFRLPDGTNVLLAAVASGKLKALELALKLAPDANIATESGDTSLHILLSNGTGPELAPMMKLLAERGARTDLKNRSGKTATDIAKEAQTDAKLAYDAAFATQRVGKL